MAQDFIKVRATLRGVRPLLMQSGVGADPLSQWAKKRSELSKIRNKTEQIHLQLLELDWYSAFYTDDQRKPVILGTMIEASGYEGAKRSRLGKEVKAGVLVDGNYRLQHDHPLGDDATIDDFWANPRYRDIRGVIVQGKRIMRCRPVFPVWSLTYEASLFEIDVHKYKAIMEAAGQFCGLGTYRPKFGQYEIVSLEKI